MDNEDSLESFEEQLLNITALFKLNDQNLADEDSLESFEEQSLNITALFESNNQNLVKSDDQNLAESNDQNLAKMVDTPTVRQIFGSREELDRYIFLYARSQNFVSVIRGSEYDNGRNGTKKKTCIAENQRQMQSKRTGYRWQIRASCPKTTGILSISSLFLSHNDHPIKDETNKFAVKYRAFSEDMLKNIKFWTEIGNLNMRTQSQMLMKRYPDAATLLNHLLECKAEDTRWVINWKVDPTNNSLISLFWMPPD
ncbi:3477_t:CDS:2 [Gigaspora margarita]|uniref:3477_t:CDS:1 n=1 Tax=Gigaspora margarita TaxID=4874 RepID=A0ABN7W1S4_GIGMA|nr:3477_t:CDS:2 [Gigaspora margarita]